MSTQSLFSPKILSTLLLGAVPLLADIHHFGYATETGTLPAGKSEVELWNTARVGRDAYYYALDQRVEYETGITDRFSGSFYLNWNQTTDGNASQFNWQGFSTEFKYKFSDPSADPLGFALYTELGFGTETSEIEGKALFDKNLGPWILAANLIGEGEIHNRDFNTEEVELEAVAAAAYEFSPRFSAGLELRNHNDLESNDETGNEMKWMNSALFLGPSVTYNAKAFVLTFTVLPQLPALKTEGGSVLEFHDHEAVEARLHLSLRY